MKRLYDVISNFILKVRYWLLHTADVNLRLLRVYRCFPESEENQRKNYRQTAGKMYLKFS